MKRLFGFALILGLLSMPAFAAKNSENVNLSSPVTLGTMQLAAGNYDLKWTGTGATVQVAITQNGKTVATVPAKAVQTKSSQVSLSTDHVGGANVLQSIQLHKVNLIFSGATSTGE